MRSDCLWLSLLLGFVICGSIDRALSEDETTSNEVIYNRVEEIVRPEFEAAMQLLAQKSADKDPQTIKDALAGLKDAFYNNAYNYYYCLVEMVRTGGSSEGPANAEICMHGRNAELAKFSAKMTDYIPVLGAQVFARCGLTSRLFEAENEFKPYSFLKNEGIAELHDFEKYNACLIDAAK